MAFKQKKDIDKKKVDMEADRIINGAKADQYLFSKPQKKRKDQKRKTVLLPDDLYQGWIKYEATKKLEGEKVTFQAFIERYMRRELKDYID